MSTVTAFAYCHNCHELTTGIDDQAKGFLITQESNHFGHHVEPFGDPAKLPAPIFNTIARLGAGLPVTNNHITMLRLGFDLHDYPTGALEAECPPARSTAPGAGHTSMMSPAPARASAASTRSLPVSTPTPDTPAREADLLDLLGGVA